jgi:maleate isomerase
MKERDTKGVVNSSVRVGLLIPSSNTVMEVDLYRHLPEHIHLHTARMYLEKTTRKAEKRMVEEFAPDAAASVKTANPHFVVFGCTSAGSLGGQKYDHEICQRLSEITGVPTIGVFSCVREVLARLKAVSIAVITPYVDDLNSSIQKGLEEDGFEVVAIHGMGIDVNLEIAKVPPEEIAAFSLDKLKGARADAIFISCTNFRAMEALPLLRPQFKPSIVTSNTATLEAIISTTKRISPGQPELAQG